jgi:hypothetical protein
MGKADRRMTYETIRLTWLPNWRAYAVRSNGRVLGMIQCKIPLPFRAPVEFT